MATTASSLTPAVPTDTDEYVMVAGTSWKTSTYAQLKTQLTSDGFAATGISNVVEDTTPQLGGALDAQDNNITGVGNLGVGTDAPSQPLEVVAPNIGSGVRETIAKFGVHDGGNSHFFIGNGTSANSSMAPILGGCNDNASTTWSAALNGYVTSTLDTGSASHGVVAVNCFRTTTPSDPPNGTLSAVVTRRLFSVTNYTSTKFFVEAGGTVGFGTHTGSGDVAVSGYITIKDSGGTSRKLAVIT